MPSPMVVVSDRDRATLECWTQSSTVSAGQRERAEIVLAVAAGAGVSGAARRLEFLDFLKRVAKAYPRRQLHIVLDNYHTHKHDDINKWLAKHPRITLHFTPTSGSWLNLVEVFFSIITRQAIRRGSFDSVKDLVAAIRAFIDGYNERCQPFVWTKTADEILPRATRQRTSAAGH
jgi:transposase